MDHDSSGHLLNLSVSDLNHNKIWYRAPRAQLVTANSRESTPIADNEEFDDLVDHTHSLCLNLNQELKHPSRFTFGAIRNYVILYCVRHTETVAYSATSTSISPSMINEESCFNTVRATVRAYYIRSRALARTSVNVCAKTFDGSCSNAIALKS